MPIVDLDRQQGLALLAEMTSTRNLLAYGIRIIRTGAFIETTRDPILTMLSIGVEKLYKLTLGLIALDERRTWLTRDEMKAHGHNLVAMHQAVMESLRIRTASKSQYVRKLVVDVDADLAIEPVINALDLYGQMGRFYYLDQLGDHLQLVSPDDAWQKIERAAIADPQVASLYKQAMDHIGDNAAWDRFVRALNERIAVAVERLWIMIAVCGRNHVLGETGGVFGFEVHPDAVGRQ